MSCNLLVKCKKDTSQRIIRYIKITEQGNELKMREKLRMNRNLHINTIHVNRFFSSRRYFIEFFLLLLFIHFILTLLIHSESNKYAQQFNFPFFPYKFHEICLLSELAREREREISFIVWKCIP